MIQFRLSQHSGVPIYRQIEDQVRLGIACGHLRAGEQLPTVRALAVELAVNPNTVIKAYANLERDGVVRTEQGTGTFIAALQESPVPKAQRQSTLLALCAEFLAETSRLGFSAQEVKTEFQKLLERS
jgi:GntR family transcriptional regulator